MASINIRKGDSDDCEGLMKLIQELADYENMPDGPKINSYILKEDGFGEESFYKFFVAKDRETAKLVGYVLYFFTYSTQKGKCIYMEDLYVSPQYRNLGIGENLWKSVVKEGVLNNATSTNFAVLGWNESSIKFYEKRGAIDLTIQDKKQLLRFSKENMSNLIEKNLA